MPVIKFDQPSSLSDNKGSCAAFVNYLSKEDNWKGVDKEFFFDHKNDFIPNNIVERKIDTNKKGLGNADAKFYTGSINFSENELAFLGNDTCKIKEYAKGVFIQYASNFNNGLTIDDINWFGKIETNRYYKGDDPEVKNGKKRQGEKKEGNNIHVHFIIGRKTVDGKRKISPITNHQNTKSGPVVGGFCRDQFYETCEKCFDNMFNYNRPISESYESYKISANGDFSEKVYQKQEQIENEIQRAKYKNLSVTEKITRLNKLIQFIQFGANPQLDYWLDSEKLLNYERENGFNGSVYRSLMNLNSRIKNGYRPNPESLTDMILKYASFLNVTNHDQQQQNNIELKIKIMEKVPSQPEKSDSSPFANSSNELNILPPNIKKEEEDEIPFWRKKKKKKRWFGV